MARSTWKIWKVDYFKKHYPIIYNRLVKNVGGTIKNLEPITNEEFIIFNIDCCFFGLSYISPTSKEEIFLGSTWRSSKSLDLMEKLKDREPNEDKYYKNMQSSLK